MIASLSAALVVSLADLGLRSALLYNISRICGRDEALREGLAVASRMLVVASLTALALYLAGFALGRGSLFKGVGPWLAAGSFAYCLSMLSQEVLIFLLMGLRDFRGRNLVAALPPALGLAALAFHWRTGERLGAGEMLAIQVGGMSATIVVGVAYLVTSYRPRFALRAPEGWIGRYLPYGLKSALAQCLVNMNLRLDALILNSLLGNHAVGLYSAGVSAAELIQHVPNSVTVVLFPEMGALGERERRKALELALGASLYMVAVGVLALGLVTPWLLPAIFGRAFAPAVSPALWLLPGMAGLAALRVLGTAASSQGRPQDRSYAAAIGLVANVALNLALIPRHGLVAAAWSSSLSYSLSAVVLLWLYARSAGTTPLRVLAGAGIEPIRWLRNRLSRPDTIQVHALP